MMQTCFFMTVTLGTNPLAVIVPPASFFRRDRPVNLWYYPDMQNPPAPVPRYALLGEEPGHGHEELVHCETIAARSIRYDWDIPPHRHPALCQLLLVFDGQARIVLDCHATRPTAPFALVAPSGAVHAFRFSSDVDGLVLTLSNTLVQTLSADGALADMVHMPRIAPLSPDIAARVRAVGQQILLSAGAAPAREMLRRTLAEALLRILAEGDTGPERDHGDRLVTRFQSLVETHCRSERRLQFYARTLGCTERTLARRVRAALDVSPIEFVNQRLSAEATRLLRFTNASCAHVADELGFEDPSYFSRFYRRMTGRAPSEVSGREPG